MSKKPIGPYLRVYLEDEKTLGRVAKYFNSTHIRVYPFELEINIPVYRVSKCFWRLVYIMERHYLEGEIVTPSESKVAPKLYWDCPLSLIESSKFYEALYDKEIVPATKVVEYKEARRNYVVYLMLSNFHD